MVVISGEDETSLLIIEPLHHHREHYVDISGRADICGVKYIFSMYCCVVLRVGLCCCFVFVETM